MAVKEQDEFVVAWSRNIGVVISQLQVAPRYFRMRLSAPHIASLARAGQFVHVLARNGVTHDPLLRRAFSVLSAHENEIEILYRTDGRGTALMSEWQTGVQVDLLGPLGNGFALLPENKRAILVGGGVGVPPLAMLASQCMANQDLIALIGARSAQDIICTDDFVRSQTPFRIATDDGSVGYHGLVTNLLKIELNHIETSIVYACGPLPMLRAVAKLCADFSVPCQVSLEENMPCGVGVCNGCVVPTTDLGDDYGRFRRICVEGPVMCASEINWDGLSQGGHQ